ncbi:hypothetical protein [Ruegeria sp.]|uniref:hypothetical protein n=1 Tax=Ruegeria sp. TaxID=1879320 RepID=UPI003B5BFF77
MTTITQLPDAGTLNGDEFVETSQPSTTTKITATTISAQASDNSYNDSGSGFVTAGFAVGNRVVVAGFSGNAVNNITVAEITALTVAKMTIGGTEGDVIVDEAAGDSVTISKWESRKALMSNIGTGGGGGGGGTLTLTEGMQTISPNNTVSSYEIDITGFQEVEITAIDVTFAAADRLEVQFSTDGGSTWEAANTDYVQSYFDAVSAVAAYSAGSFPLGFGADTDGEQIAARFWGLQVGRPSYYTMGGHHVRSANRGGAASARVRGGWTDFAGPVNRMRIISGSSNNISGGTIIVTGRKNQFTHGSGTPVLGSVAGVDTITASLTPALSAYSELVEVLLVTAGANTGAVTLNIDSLGAKSVVKAGGAALAASDLASGEAVKLWYDAGNDRFQVIGL